MKIASSDNFEGIDLWYPNLPDQRKELRVSMVSVRACGDLLISYDFKRDGWVIKMQPVQEDGGIWPVVEVGGPVEVAFLPAFHEVEK